MLKRLQEQNPEIGIYAVTDPAFSTYGKVIDLPGTQDILDAAKAIPDPETGSSYAPSVEAFEALPIAEEIRNRHFGTLPTQVGYCWGSNTFLNATEWHFSSEINIAVKPLVLILGHVWEIENGKINASRFKAFYLPAGTAVEVFATTLHFCPCQVSDEGFGCVVALPAGTNTNLTEPAQEPLLFRKNKWIIAHVENTALIEKGVLPGITGPNYQIRY